jgi:hypothetical protein
LRVVVSTCAANGHSTGRFDFAAAAQDILILLTISGDKVVSGSSARDEDAH